MYTSEHAWINAMTSTMTIRLDKDLKDRLDRLSEATDRSKSYLAAQAVRDFVELNEWQILETQKAVVAADKSEFASPGDVEALKRRWASSNGS